MKEMGKRAKEASRILATKSSRQINELLEGISAGLEASSEFILRANEEDMDEARRSGLATAMLDRLLLTEERLKAIARDVLAVAALPCPVGQVLDGGYAASGISLVRRRVPLGVVGVIYEARPNVTVDVASLCLKTGNAAILRGGKETLRTNMALVGVIRRALEQGGFPADCVQFIANQNREMVTALLKLDQYVDIIIPRGGAGLQRLCQEQATIPVILGGIGICHMFVDETALQENALKIIENAKVPRPTVCNSVETVLVHSAIASEFLPRLSDWMHTKGVTLHACPSAMTILKSGNAAVLPLKEEELTQEWLSLDLNVCIVNSLTEAIDHISQYGSRHSDAILTQDVANADRFVLEVDSAAVYVNTSTRFTDGGEFGLGAEVAVSTQKLHARGPMGLDALTSYKWIVKSDHLTR